MKVTAAEITTSILKDNEAIFFTKLETSYLIDILNIRQLRLTLEKDFQHGNPEGIAELEAEIQQIISIKKKLKAERE